MTRTLAIHDHPELHEIFIETPCNLQVIPMFLIFGCAKMHFVRDLDTGEPSQHIQTTLIEGAVVWELTASRWWRRGKAPQRS
jgi:hypothetical protein